MTDAGHMSGGAPVVPTPPVPEPTYTLAEAKRLLREQELATCTHEDLLTITERHQGAPVGMVCERCGKRWTVTPA